MIVQLAATVSSVFVGGRLMCEGILGIFVLQQQCCGL